MFNKLTICLIAVATILLPTTLSAEDIAQPPSPKASYMLLADVESTQLGIPSYQVKGVLKLESDYNGDVVGDHGLAHSCAQFHQATFEQYETLYFIANNIHLQYLSCPDQITLMTWMWATFPQTKILWSSYRHLYGVQSKSTIKSNK